MSHGGSVTTRLAYTTVLARLQRDFAIRVGASPGTTGTMHLVHSAARSNFALCGCPASNQPMPVTHWRVDGQRHVRWCAMCEAEAIELLDRAQDPVNRNRQPGY